MQWNPWHRVEYHLEHTKGVTEHLYTERVADTGWRDSMIGLTAEEYFVYYTKGCALDFLERRGAPPGTYVVAVYDDNGKRVPLGSIRMEWHTPPPVAPIGDPAVRLRKP